MPQNAEVISLSVLCSCLSKMSNETQPSSWADRLNARVADSRFGRFFELDKRNTTFLQELRAGIVCFLTVCYIIREFHPDLHCQIYLSRNNISPCSDLICVIVRTAVNSGILADTGGSCVPAVNCNVSPSGGTRRLVVGNMGPARSRVSLCVLPPS